MPVTCRIVCGMCLVTARNDRGMDKVDDVSQVTLVSARVRGHTFLSGGLHGYSCKGYSCKGYSCKE